MGNKREPRYKLDNPNLLKSEATLSQFLNSLSDLALLIDTNGYVLFCNEYGSQIIHKPLHEIVGHCLWDIFTPKATSFRKSITEDVIKTKKPNRVVDHQAQTTFDTIVTPILDSKGRVIKLGILSRDISHSLQLEKALKRSQERLHEEEVVQHIAARAESLARLAEGINAHLDLEIVLNSVCEETARTTGYPICSVLLVNEYGDGMYVAAATGPSIGSQKTMRPAPLSLYKMYQQSSEDALIIPDVYELPDLHDPNLVSLLEARTFIAVKIQQDAQLIGLLTVSSQNDVKVPTQEDIEFITAIAHQAAIAITNARLFEQLLAGRARLQALSQKLVATQEIERKNLARELHDEIGQMLTSLNISLSMASKAGSSNGNGQSFQLELTRAQELVNKLLQQVRDLSLDLRPALLDDLGLLPALLAYFDRYSNLTNIRVNFKHTGCEKRFSPETEVTAFRIVQEALTNVARHAEVIDVDVRIWVDPDGIHIQVEDRGVGFDVQKLNYIDSIGISGMRERSILCAGSLEIDSQPGLGTCLTANLPLYQHEGRA